MQVPGYEELFEEKVDALYVLYQQKREYDAALVAEEAARGAVLQHEVPPVTEPREGSPDSPLQAPVTPLGADELNLHVDGEPSVFTPLANAKVPLCSWVHDGASRVLGGGGKGPCTLQWGEAPPDGVEFKNGVESGFALCCAEGQRAASLACGPKSLC